MPFYGCFYPKCLMVTQGNKYICGMGGLSREGTPKPGTVTHMLHSLWYRPGLTAPLLSTFQSAFL